MCAIINGRPIKIITVPDDMSSFTKPTITSFPNVVLPADNEVARHWKREAGGYFNLNFMYKVFNV